MRISAKKIEPFVNVAIVIAVVILAGILTNRYFLNRTDKTGDHAKTDNRLTRGRKISLPDVDWQTNQRTLMLVLSRDCPYCLENVPFYQKVSGQLAERQNTRLMALMQEPAEESRAYLKEIGLQIEVTIQVPLNSIGVIGTPTLALINGEGIVKDIWVGKLTDNQESEIMNMLAVSDDQLDSVESGYSRTDMDAADLKRITESGQQVIVLDVDARTDYTLGHIPGAKNIPLDELEMRALNELPNSHLIVTYCRCAEDELSRIASEPLNRQGFRQISVLRNGLNGWKQAGSPVVNQ